MIIKRKDRLRRYITCIRRQKDPSKQSKTKLKKQEEALSLSQDRLRALVETTSDWIWEIDARGNYTYVSPKVTALLGYRYLYMDYKTGTSSARYHITMQGPIGGVMFSF